MSGFLAALASLPRLATALESLVETLSGLNARVAKSRAAKRRQDKDDEVDSRIAGLVDVTSSGVLGGTSGELSSLDGTPGVSRSSDPCPCVHCRCAEDNQPSRRTD